MTNLPTKSEMGGDPNGVQRRKQELERVLDDFDERTGKKPKSREIPKVKEKPEEHEEQEHNFYKESPEMKARQAAFDETIKNRSAKSWQSGPVSKKDRLLAWHKALGSPQHVIDAELKDLEDLEDQETRK